MIKHKLEVLKTKTSDTHLLNLKKMILASIGILICLFIIIVIYKEKDDKSLKADENLAVLFDADRPILINESNAYGFVLKNGDTLIRPSLQFASPFWNGYSAISEKEGNFELIDKDGNTVLEVSNSQEPKYFKECGLWLIDNKLYDKDLKVIFDDDSRLEYISQGFFIYMKNGKRESGIIDKKGQKVFAWDSDYITVTISQSPTELNDYYAVVSDYEAREEIINLKTGDSVFKIDDANTKYLRQEKNNIFRVINRQESYKTEKWIYIKDGKIIYETTDEIYSLELISRDADIIKIDYGQNYKDFHKDTRYTYYNTTTKSYIDEPALYKADFDEFIIGFDYDIYTEDKKYGLKIKDTIYLEPKYDKIDFLEYNLHKYLYEFKNTEYALIESEEKTLLYDIKRNKVVEEFPSTSYTKYKDSSFLSFTLYESNGYTKKGYLIYNVLTGQSIQLDKKDEFVVDTNSILVKTSANVQIYYNIELKKIYEK